MSDDCWAYFVSVSVLVYYSGDMNADLGYGLLIVANYGIDDTSLNWYTTQTLSSYTDSANFYGVNAYTKLTTGQTSIDF